MKWIDYKIEQPAVGIRVLFCNEDDVWVSMLESKGKLPFTCTREESSTNEWDDSCSWTRLIPTHWMTLPNQPERLSEKTSKEDAIV